MENKINSKNSLNQLIEEASGIKSEYQYIHEPTNYVEDHVVPTNILEWTPGNLSKTQTDSHNYKKHLVPTTYSRGTVIMGSMTGPNLYSQLKVFAKAFPGMPGPNFVDTRDNKIVIHNGRSNGYPGFSYTYMGGTGELLEFEISTKFTQSVTSSKRTSIDPDDKSLNSEVDQCIPTEETGGKSWDMLVPEWSNYNNISVRNDVDALRMAKVNNLVNSVSQDQIEPKKTKQRKVYGSKEEAREVLSANAVLTEAEVKQFNDYFKKKFEKVSNPKSEEDYYLLTHTMNEFRDLLIFRKAVVYVDPMEYSTLEPQYAGDKDHWKSGYKALEKNKDISIVHTNKGYDPGNNWGRKGDKVMVELELAIPIPGVRVMSSPNFVAMGQSSINDVITSTTNQIEANGKFVGNPAMESSQNMEIKNIGSKYSGIWYSKEVTHNIDSSGYFTEVVYNKKSQNILVNKISSKINTQKIFQETQKIAEESYRTGAWLYPSKVLSEVEKYRAESWAETGQPSTMDGRQIGAFQLNPDDPSKWVIYEASVDFETGKPISKKLKDINL